MNITKLDFDYVRNIVRKKSAILLDDNKEYLVEMRLSALAQKEGIDDVKSLISDVRENGNVKLRDLMVEAMTTNETSFFRDRHPFDVMREKIIPEMMEKRASSRTLKVWCGAASTGQEPYSLAILLHDCMPHISSWDVKITATDISPEVLEKAENGLYTQHEVGRGLPVTMLVKNFNRKGLEWQVKDHLKALVDYRRFNLVEPWVGLPKFDIIFMRNVLIYFDTDVKKQILTNALKYLAPDGYLFLGGSETLLGLGLDYQRENLGPVSAYCPTT
ncbi:MAG: chemotaxis protein methyltransferase CheR [Planctomycetota bacterium]|jgi:chemotaxis protein methyltransferase CheR